MMTDLSRFVLTGSLQLREDTVTVADVNDILTFITGFGCVTSSKADIINEFVVRFKVDISEKDDFTAGATFVEIRQELDEQLTQYGPVEYAVQRPDGS